MTTATDDKNLPDGVTIPTDADGLKEILNNDKLREKVFANKATSMAFMASYAKHLKGADAIAAQVTEQMGETLQTLLAEHGGTNRPDQSSFTVNLNTSPTNWSNSLGGPQGQGRGGLPYWSSGFRNAIHNPDQPTAKLDDLYRAFDGFGQMALDVHNHRQNKPVKNAEAWARVMEVTNAYSETDPSAGGFLVPEEMRAMIMSLALEQSIMRSRATVITMSSLTTSIPYVDATTHVGSVFGGMVFYWVGESTAPSKTEARFGKVKLEANKLMGAAAIPNELYADAAALTTWLNSAAPLGIAFYEDLAFLTGSGVGQPLGLLNSEALVSYDRATASDLTPADIYGMFARMLPQSLGNAVWLVNQKSLPQIFELAQAVGTGGAPVNILDISAGPRMSLLGRPLIVTEKIPTLGSANDLLFIDPSYYLIGDRQGVSLDYSEHSRFSTDETELRIIERVDGRPWVQSTMTPVNGDPLSPFVGISAT